MAVPKRRTSRSKSGKRRSHQGLDRPNVSFCTQCNAPVLPHHVCDKCGMYQGRTAVVVEQES